MEAEKPKHLRPSSSLPYDVIINILKNLPIQTLIRCRCVCKDWNSVIAGQSFINAHLLSQPQGHLFLSQPQGRLFCRYNESFVPSDETQLISFFPGESLSLVRKFEMPLPWSSQLGFWKILVSSLDGLLCLTDSKPFGRNLYLWNPTIRKYKTLSNSCLFNENDRQSFFHPKTIAFGLGFCVHNSDHIIIRIVVFGSESEKLKSNRLPEAEVYSLSTASWKKVEVFEDVSKRLTDIWSRVYVNLHGDLNWMATFSDEEGREYESILSFDVNKEEFKEIKLPSDYKNGIDANSQRIAVYRGSLAVIISGVSIPKDGNVYVWLWVMEEYGKEDSWTRTTVAKVGLRYFALDGCTLDGRIMVSRRSCVRTSVNGTIIQLLDAETLEEQQFRVSDFQCVHTFKETLLSPGS